MGLFDGKVAIVTGAGRGIGREEALLLAAEGAMVVVNDLGGTADGSGADTGPAHAVVEAIKTAGGTAAASTHDIATWDGGDAIVGLAVERFGRLDAVINNAGILRDRMSFTMSEAEWDAVIDVHLKGHFAVARHAAAWWRARFKETGEPTGGAIVNTSSESGLYGNAGQSNYAAAKAGIAALTLVQAVELARYGITANAIVPGAAAKILGHDRAAGLFVMEYLSPETHRSWKEDLRQGRADPAFAAKVGALLARIHAGTANDTGWPSSRVAWK